MKSLEAVFDWPSLAAQLKPLPGLVIAYSGGVDSAVLVHAARRCLGKSRVLAVLADSPSLAREEKSEALKVAAELDVDLLLLQTEEIRNPRYRQNQGDRCFWCKEALFLAAEIPALERDWPVAYGEQADDDRDDRPGSRSAAGRGVLAPLRAAGWGKESIRAYARLQRLSIAEKPAAPCLASRIVEGVPVSLQALSKVELLEKALRTRGYQIFRARFLGEGQTRFEFQASELPRALAEREGLARLAEQAGFPSLEIRAYARPS
ncbi:MAG: hypothetical protein DWQ01_15790 [Planctomycetota bacterium]|nr:MAG: hypothetical protein DWQ01_15790 [Planctomycetota bacterium]